MSRLTDRAWAIFFCRAILGFIFFMAGIYKCFRMTPMQVLIFLLFGALLAAPLLVWRREFSNA